MVVVVEDWVEVNVDDVVVGLGGDAMDTADHSNVCKKRKHENGNQH